MKTTPEKTKVFCFTQDVKITLAPHRWLDILEKVLESPDQIVKQDEWNRTAKVGLSPWGDVCARETRWTTGRNLLSFLKPFRRKLFWSNLLEIQREKIPVAKPVLYLEVKKGRFVTKSYLVSKWIEGDNLGSMALNRTPSSERELMDLVKRATWIVSDLHSAGFIHGDLKWSNILTDFSRPGELFLSGLDKVRASASYSSHGEDLARFVLFVYEYDMGRDVADAVVNWYFQASGYRPETFDWSLVKQIRKNKRKHESRGRRG